MSFLFLIMLHVLKINSQRQLNLPCSGSGFKNSTKARIGVGATPTSKTLARPFRRVKVGPVEDIEELGPELNTGCLTDRNALENGDIHGGDSGTDGCIAPQGPEITSLTRLEVVRGVSEPAVGTACIGSVGLAWNQVGPLVAKITHSISALIDLDGRAIGQSQESVELPAFNHLAPGTGGTGAKATTWPKWQVKGGVSAEGLRCIPGGGSLVHVGILPVHATCIAGVEIAGRTGVVGAVIQELLEGVRELVGETGIESSLEAQLHSMVGRIPIKLSSLDLTERRIGSGRIPRDEAPPIGFDNSRRCIGIYDTSQVDSPGTGIGGRHGRAGKDLALEAQVPLLDVGLLDLEDLSHVGRLDGAIRGLRVS